MGPGDLARAVLGAGVMVIENSSRTIDLLALRGEAVVQRRRARIERRVDRAGRTLARLRDNAAESTEVALEGFWHAIGVPTRSDVTELERRIDALRHTIDRLSDR